MTGKVVAFDDKMGYGFIADKRNRLVFVHYSEIITPDLRKNLAPGDEVEFDLYEDEKGFFAVGVKKL